jgi:hypothetical protein
MNAHTDFSGFGETVSAMPGFGCLSAAALNAMTFEPVRFVVPGILPEGLAILAGKPKFGKSFAVMDMAMAVASGGKAFGKIDCEAGDVLYCALEDGERRLQDRLRKLLPPGHCGEVPDRLFIETVAPRLGDGLIEALEAWTERHPDARLIVLDTWVHIKPPGKGTSSAYDEDAQGLKPLHHFAKCHPGLAVVVIHHTRKLDADDPFDTISGTHGLTGMADTLMVMARQGDTTKLCGQGRDIEGYEKAIERDTFTGGWRILGEASERAKTSERQAILDELREADGAALSPAQIATATGKQRTNIQHLLKRLQAEGLIEKAGYGKWKLSDTHSHHSHRSHFSEPAEQECEQSERKSERSARAPAQGKPGKSEQSERHSTPDDLGPGDWVPDYAPDTEPPVMDPWL